MKVIRVAILMDTSGYAGRLMLRGIGAYARTNRRWNCQFQSPTTGNIQKLHSWRPDGVIAAVYDPAWVESLLSHGVPVVDVADSVSASPFAIVTDDNGAVGTLAAEYLLDRGFKQLAFIGIASEGYSAQRRDSFVRTAAAAGVLCRVHEVGHATTGRPDYDWQTEDEALRAFIRSLPEPPVGTFASNDGRAIQFMEAGRELGLNVPDQVAVLGCDNDDLLCDLARPPLSSVVTASERVGFEAACVLDRLIAGDKTVPRETRVPPVNVITRQSSEIMAIGDPDLARALRYIRANAHRPFKGIEVVNEVMIARRSLERRFTSLLGRTLHDEIQRAHIDQAKQLLAHTDLPMPAVAERSGFGSLRTLSLVFRSEMHTTPSAYRRKHRLGIGM